MAFSTIDKAKSYFEPVKYTGTGSSNAITSLSQQPDFLWIKKANGAEHHILIDSVRGLDKQIYSSHSSSEDTNAQSVTAVGANGFTVGTNAQTNDNGSIFWALNWKGGTTSGLSGGDITPSAYSINTTSKFGIYKYTGNGYSSQTIAHGLGATPTCVIFKQTSGSEQWRVHFMEAPNPYTKMLILNGNAAEGSQSNGLSAVSSTTITFGSDGAYNSSGGEYICYIFCDLRGYFTANTYIGNGATDGRFIYTGFRPSFVMTKYTESGGTGDWTMYNDVLNPTNPTSQWFHNDANTTTQWYDNQDTARFYSNGFKFVDGSSNANSNTSGGTYMYMAFGQPLVSSNNIPCTAR